MANPKIDITLALSGVQAVLSGLQNVDSGVKNISKNINETASKGGSRFQSFGAALKSVGSAAIATAASVAAAAASVTAVMSVGIKQAASMGSRISDISSRTGIASRDVVILEQAFKNAGLTAASLPQAIGYMDKALIRARDQGGQTAKAFAKLGLNINELINEQDTGKKFFTIANAISKVGNSTERTAIAMRIFEEGGGKFLTLFNESGAIARAEKMVGGLADTMGRNSGSFDAISDSINAMGIKSQQFFSGFLGQVDDLIKDILERIDGIDFTRAGERFAAFLILIKRYWVNGNISELVVLTFNAAFEQAQIGFNVLWKNILATIKSAKFWMNLLEGFSAFSAKAFIQIDIYLLKALQKFVQYFGAGMETIGSLFGYVMRKQLASTPIFRYFFKELSEEWNNEAFNGLENTWNEKLEGMKASGTPMLDSMIKDAEAAKDAIDWVFNDKDGENKVSATPDSDRLKKETDAIVDEANAKKDAAIEASKKTVEAVAVAAKTTAADTIQNINKILESARLEYSKTVNEINALSNNWRLTDESKQIEKDSLLETQKKQAIELRNELTRTIDEYNRLAQEAKEKGDNASAALYGRESTRFQNERTKIDKSIQKIEIELDAPNINGLTDQIHLAIIDVQNAFGTLEQNIGNTIKRLAESMRDSMSDFFYDTITGAKNGKDALSAMWVAMGKSAVRACADAVSNFVMSKTVMVAMEYAFSATMLAINATRNGAQLAQESAQTAALTAMWKGPALLRSIASFGAAAAVGLAAMIAIMGATGGFAEGGRVTGPKQMAWFNEQGSEYVVSAKSPTENDVFLDYANKGGMISDLFEDREFIKEYSNSSVSNTYNNSSVNNNVNERAPYVITPEVNVWNDASRNNKRRAMERAESKRMKQILRMA